MKGRTMQNTNHLPKLTDDQRREALKKAMATRTAQAKIKCQLKDGTLKVSDVLAMEDEHIKRLKVSSLLKAIPGVGEAKADAFMAKHHISKSRRIAGLGKHQKAALVEAFG